MPDLDQIIADMPRRYAVAELIGHCEGLIKSRAVEGPAKETLQMLVNRTVEAFGMEKRS